LIPVLHLGPIELPTYYLVISLVVSFCIFWAARRADKFQRSKNTTLDLTLVVMISGFLGARLFHVFYEMPSYYLEYPYAVFYIWQGGFVFYGGALASAVAAIIYCRLKKLSFFSWADFAAPVVSFGYGAGRLACYLNGCCYGRVCAADGTRYPTQLMAFGFEMLIVIALLELEKKRFFKQEGQLFCLWVLLHSVNRLIMEFYRDDERGPAPLNLSVSTWISLSLLIISGLYLWRLSRSKRQTF